MEIKHCIKVLLVEDNPGDARLIQEKLNTPQKCFTLHHEHDLKSALEFLRKNTVDVILLDLNMPDSRGIDTYHKINSSAESTAIIILTGLEDEGYAIKAMQSGAQDYLSKNMADEVLLRRSISYAIERKQLLLKVNELAVRDPLTDLYNRRGFINLAEIQYASALRNSQNMAIILIDIDKMKAINDNFGHLAGDDAIIKTAGILKKAFRETDVIGRIGGDEFTVFALEPDLDSFESIIRKRVKDELVAHVEEPAYEYSLSLSLGFAFYNEQKKQSFDELLKTADENMYKDKVGSK